MQAIAINKIAQTQKTIVTYPQTLISRYLELVESVTGNKLPLEGTGMKLSHIVPFDILFRKVPRARSELATVTS